MKVFQHLGELHQWLFLCLLKCWQWIKTYKENFSFSVGNIRGPTFWGTCALLQGCEYHHKCFPSIESRVSVLFLEHTDLWWDLSFANSKVRLSDGLGGNPSKLVKPGFSRDGSCMAGNWPAHLGAAVNHRNLAIDTWQHEIKQWENPDLNHGWIYIESILVYVGG